MPSRDRSELVERATKIMGCNHPADQGDQNGDPYPNPPSSALGRVVEQASKDNMMENRVPCFFISLDYHEVVYLVLKKDEIPSKGDYYQVCSGESFVQGFVEFVGWAVDVRFSLETKTRIILIRADRSMAKIVEIVGFSPATRPHLPGARAQAAVETFYEFPLSSFLGDTPYKTSGEEQNQEDSEKDRFPSSLNMIIDGLERKKSQKND